jgi:protein-S-isoprenylcysteine O-methyltransferase Ste14
MIDEILVRQGGWLFRWRSYVLLGFGPLILWAISGSEPIASNFGPMIDGLYEAGCVALALAGLAIRALTAGFVPRGTSGRNTSRQIADSLNVTGMYSLTRNPLYLGNALTIMGVTLFAQSLYLALLMGLFLVLYLERIIAAEERFLMAQFGQAYVDWATSVPAFFPRPSGWVQPELAFSWRTVLKREHSSMMAILASLFVIDQARDFLYLSKASFDPAWLAALAVATVAYGVLVWMKKRTRLLNVDGR